MNNYSSPLKNVFDQKSVFLLAVILFAISSCSSLKVRQDIIYDELVKPGEHTVWDKMNDPFSAEMKETSIT